AGASLLTLIVGPVCDGRKIFSERSRFEVFDRVICRAVGRLVSSGEITYKRAVRAVKKIYWKQLKRHCMRLKYVLMAGLFSDEISG
ncbi:MAG: glucuronate isomerase, partial [bacterium]